MSIFFAIKELVSIKIHGMAICNCILYSGKVTEKEAVIRLLMHLVIIGIIKQDHNTTTNQQNLYQ